MIHLSTEEVGKAGVKQTDHESVAGRVSGDSNATVTRSVDNHDGEYCCGKFDEKNRKSLDAKIHFGKAGFDAESYFSKANRNNSDDGLSGGAYHNKALETGLNGGYQQSIVNESLSQEY